jgi:polar amino acid transport system permease protein
LRSLKNVWRAAKPVRREGAVMESLLAVRGMMWNAVLWLWSSIGFNAPLLDRYAWRILDGITLTMQLVALSILLGMLLALPIALARVGSNTLLRRLAYGYIYFFRGTPLVAQLFLIYYGLGDVLSAHVGTIEDWGLLWLYRDPFWYVLLAFVLNTAAYQAEILRGGIESVPRGQWEGGRAVGLTDRQIMRKIVLPQAAIIGLRPFGNEVILMVKASSVAALVSVFDIMGTVRFAFSRSFDFETYLWAAILYLVFVETLRRVWDRIEFALTRHLRPATG